MRSSQHRWSRGAALLGGLALILAACGGPAAISSPRATAGAPTATTAAPTATAAAPTATAPAPSASAVAPSASAVAPSASPAGSPGAGVDLTGKTFTVGSKEFTEQLILGQITMQVLQHAGATVKDQTGLVGSTVAREALTSGKIDMYWEYTGTGWINHLHHTTPVAGAQQQFDAVKAEDAGNGIAWLDPAPFNNTYAIALATEKATELGLSTLSDVAAYANANPAEATMCGAAEFLGRDDGLPGLEKAYGFKFNKISELELGLVYTSIDKGDPCLFGEVFATDSRMIALGLTVLQDDKGFFPSYLPSLNVRQPVLDASPGLAQLFAPVAAALDDATMLSLNAKVDVDGMEPAAVATAFLADKGLMK